MRGVDNLVDQTERHSPVHASSHSLALVHQLAKHAFAIALRHGRQLSAVQDADRGLGTHHRDLRIRPGVYRGGTQRAGIHDRREQGPHVVSPARRRRQQGTKVHRRRRRALIE